MRLLLHLTHLKRIAIALLYVAAPLFVTAQTKSKHFSSEKDSLDFIINFRKGASFILNSNNDSALFYFRKAEKIVPRVNHPVNVSILKLNKLNAFRGLESFDSAYASFNEIRTIYQQSSTVEGIKLPISYAYNNIGAMYSDIGDNINAENYFLEGLRLKEAIGDSNSIGMSYMNLGQILLKLDDRKGAVKMLNTALKVFESFPDTFGIAGTLNNLSLIARRNEEFDLARTYYDSALAISKHPCARQKEIWGFTYQNLAGMYTRLNKLDTALAYIDTAFQIALDIDKKGDIAFCLNERSEIMLRKKAYRRATNLSLKSYKYAVLANSKKRKLDCASTLQKCYLELKMMDSAYHWLSEYYAIKEEISGIDKVHEIAALRLAHQEEKATIQLTNLNASLETERKLLKTEKEKNELKTTNNRILLFLTVLLVGIVAGLWYTIKIIQSKNGLLLNANEEIKSKNTLLRETNTKLGQSFELLKAFQKKIYQSGRNTLFAARAKGGKREHISIQGITHIEKKKEFDTAFIYTDNGTVYSKKMTISKATSAELKDTAFVQVNKSTLINLLFLKKVDEQKNVVVIRSSEFDNRLKKTIWKLTPFELFETGKIREELLKGVAEYLLVNELLIKKQKN